MRIFLESFYVWIKVIRFVALGSTPSRRSSIHDAIDVLFYIKLMYYLTLKIGQNLLHTVGEIQEAQDGSL